MSDFGANADMGPFAGLGPPVVNDPTRMSIAEMGEHWTKLPMISTLDDICSIWSKRASGTSIVPSPYRLVVVPSQLGSAVGQKCRMTRDCYLRT
jgi:hypothetical protein